MDLHPVLQAYPLLLPSFVPPLGQMVPMGLDFLLLPLHMLPAPHFHPADPTFTKPRQEVFSELTLWVRALSVP